MSLFSRCAVWVGAVWVRRVFKSLVGAALLYHALLAWVLPAVVHSQLPTWLHNKTGHTLRMGKPHINPWTWSVTVPKLQLDTPQGQTLVAFNQLQVDIAPKALLTGTLALHTVDCQGLAVHTGLLPNGQFNWAPLIQALQPAHPEPEGPPPAFSLGRLVLQQATLSFADERTPQGFRTQLDPINLQLQHVSTRSTTAGQLELHARTSFNAEVHIQAQVALQQPSVQGRIQIQGANLALLAQALEGVWPGPTPTGTVGLQADVALSLPEGKPQVLVDQLDINGQELALQAPTGQTHLALGFKQVKLNASAINSAPLDQPIPLQVHIDMQSGGQVEAQAQYTPSTHALQADIKVDQLHLAWLQPFIGQAVRLELASGIATGQAHIALANDWQVVGQLAIKQLRLNHAGSTQAALALNTINTPKFELTPKGLQVGELNVSGLKTALLIAKNKTTNFSNLQTQPTQKVEAQTAPFGVRIQQINLSNSALDFADESLLTPFGTHIHHLNGRLNNVNMPANGHTRLTLTGEVDEFGWAQAQGELNLFDPLRFLNLGVKFENLALNSLTPYSATFANRKIEAGKLNLNLAYRVENQQLNSTNQVRIQNLVLGDRVNSPQATDLPLDLAIALLQDSQGRIQLDLPISGSLNNPEFSYGAIVWKAIGNVLTKAVSAPFRALAGLFGHEDPLEPPQFQPGADTLLPPQRERLLLLAQALEKRPNLVLTIQTGWAPADQEALAQPPSPAPKPTPEQLQQQLTHLAEKRQALVLEGLQAAGLGPNRVQVAPLGPLPPAADAAWVPVELKLTHQRP